MKCNQCGNIVNVQDKFCQNCGAPMSQGIQNQTVGTVQNGPQPIQNQGVMNGVNANPTPSLQQTSGDHLGGMPPYNNMQVGSTPNYNSGYNYSNSSRRVSAIAILGIIGFLLIAGFFLFFVPIPFVSNKLGKGKQSFLSSDDKKGENDLVCTYRGNSIDTQITIHYDGSKVEKLKYSFIYDTSYNNDNLSITGDGFHASTNGEVSINPDDITVCDEYGNCEGREESMDEKSLELFMGFRMMSTSICYEKGVNCIDKKEGNYQKNAYEFTPSLITNRQIQESFVEDIADYSKNQIKSMLESEYGLTCK